MINNVIAEKLNKNFDEIAPFCFFYEVATDKSKVMSKKFKEFYLRSEPISNKSLSSLSEVSLKFFINFKNLPFQSFLVTVMLATMFTDSHI